MTTFNKTRDEYGFLIDKDATLDRWVNNYTNNVLSRVLQERIHQMECGLSPEIDEDINNHPEVLYLNIFKALAEPMKNTAKGVDFASREAYYAFVRAATYCVFAAEWVFRKLPECPKEKTGEQRADTAA